MTFEEELSKSTNAWIIRIGNYLKSRDDMQESLKKENKSLDECFRYVLNEIANRFRKDNENSVYASGDDEEIYSLAVHYYDEDDIKAPENLNFRTNALENKKSKETEDIQKKIDKAVNNAIKEYKEKEKKDKLRKKTHKNPKNENDNQISIFDLDEKAVQI